MALTGSVAGQKVLTFVTTIVIARTFKLTDYGGFVAASALAYVVGTVTDLGLFTHTWLGIARHSRSTSAYFTYALAAKSLLAPLAYALTIGVAAFVHLPRESTGVLPFLAVGYICWSATELTFAVYRAREQMHLEATVMILYQFALLSSAVGVAFTHANIQTLGLLTAATSALALVASLVVTQARFHGLIKVADVSQMARWLAATLPFAAYSAVTVVFFRSDVVIVTALGGATVGGVYAASLIAPTAYLAVVQSLSQAAFSGLARYFETDRPRFDHLSRRTVQLALLWGIFACAITWLALGDALELVLGPRFAGLASIIRIMAGGVIPSFLGYSLLYILNAIGHVRKVATGIALAVLVSAVSNVILVPRFGILGAALAYILTQTALAAALVRIYLGTFGINSFRLISLLATVCAIAAATVLSNLSIPVALHEFLALVPIAAMAVIWWHVILNPADRASVKRGVTRSIPRARELSSSLKTALKSTIHMR